MTPEERIASGGAVLALDTNALTGFRRLAGLCNSINLLRTTAEPLDLRLCVPAVVHMEVLFDLRQRHGVSFDADSVLQGLLDKGLTVAPFDEKHAARAAAHLAANFPRNADWQIAKRRRCIQCLGLVLPDEEARALALRKRPCGATVDWVVAAHAAHEGWILVTSDNGPEFAGLELRVSAELYYDTTYAMTKQDAWTSQYEFGNNGDGSIWYPGKPSIIGGTTDIPIESLRMKMLREGMQDYEYLNLLTKLGDGAFARDELAKVTQGTTLTADPGVLDQARLDMADRIEKDLANAPDGGAGGSMPDGGATGGAGGVDGGATGGGGASSGASGGAGGMGHGPWKGCGCEAAPAGTSGWVFAALPLAAVWARRRRRGRAGSTERT